MQSVGKSHAMLGLTFVTSKMGGTDEKTSEVPLSFKVLSSHMICIKCSLFIYLEFFYSVNVLYLFGDAF